MLFFDVIREFQNTVSSLCLDFQTFAMLLVADEIHVLLVMIIN